MIILAILGYYFAGFCATYMLAWGFVSPATLAPSHVWSKAYRDAGAVAACWPVTLPLIVGVLAYMTLRWLFRWTVLKGFIGIPKRAYQAIYDVTHD